MIGTLLPDSRLKYWTIHETACWFASEIPNYEDAENQVLGRSAGSDEVAKLYRLLKDDVIDGTLPCSDAFGSRHIQRTSLTPMHSTQLCLVES